MEGVMQLPYDVTVKVMLASLERNLLPDAVHGCFWRPACAPATGIPPSCSSPTSSVSPTYLEKCLLLSRPRNRGNNIMKYRPPSSSSCSGSISNIVSLDDAEKAMLELYCERSQLKDGHTVLDVGCGWGSLVLYIAQNYKNCKVTGICNSTTQKAHIEEQCQDLQLGNVEIIVADISTFEIDASYDRIFSIGMFEHMKNYKELLHKISNWMKDDSLLFVHYFCHKVFAYHFEDINEDDWITRYFFTGGTMPAANLLLYFQDDVSIVDQWLVNGKHYAQTSEEWLKRMDCNLGSIKPIMEATYGKDSAVKWTVYWRTFFIAVAELFGYHSGDEWMVAHFLFKKK